MKASHAKSATFVDLTIRRRLSLSPANSTMTRSDDDGGQSDKQSSLFSSSRRADVATKNAVTLSDSAAN